MQLPTCVIFGTQSRMKCLFAIFGLLLLEFTTQAALPQPDLLAQIHFAGVQKISADAHANAFTNEFCSKEAVALRVQTANKLAGWLAGWLQTNLNVTVAGGSAKLRPLFDDLQTAEWLLEARATPGGEPEVAIAIKLDPARAQLWQANLKPFFAAATFTSVGGWLIFDSNPALLKLGDRLAQRLSVPPAGWLDLDLNWPRLAQWYPTFKELVLPETQFTITAPDNNFRINGKFYFAENLNLNLEPWRVPTNTLHQPFDSFTAVRGFAPWLQSQAWAQPFQIAPVPNQLFAWGLTSYPFQTFAAIPVPDAPSALSQLYARLVSVFNAANARNYFAAPMTPELTNDEIGFSSMPTIAPKLRALIEPAGHYLFLEPFPNSVRSKSLPPELFQRLATKNLVFYHWEITAVRLPQLLQLSQYGLMMTRRKQLEDESASFKWLQRIGAALGNTDTEIAQSGPAELTFERKTAGIFTAAELFTLANWLEATNFPGFDLKLPPPAPRIRRQQQQQQTPRVISIPAPAPGH
jgi:hypothetical protein